MAKKIKIPKSVLNLRMSPKKYAKKNDIRLKGKGMSKKDKKHQMRRLEKEYSEAAINGLNKAVKILAENPVENKRVAKVRDGVDNIISNPSVMKRIAKIYRKQPEAYNNLIYLPHMIMNTLTYYQSENLTEEEKAIAATLDTEGLITFCEKILKKEIKRYKKKGLPDEVAYQMATVIPTTKLFKNRQWYRKMIQQLYEMAISTPVDLDALLKAVLHVDKKKGISRKDFLEGFFSEVIMMKVSNKNKTFTDSQKQLQEDLIDRALKYLNGLKPNKLRGILKNYIKRRKTAESYKNDMNRVIKFTDHANSNSPYVTIKAVVTDLIADNSQNELYLS